MYANDFAYMGLHAALQVVQRNFSNCLNNCSSMYKLDLASSYFFCLYFFFNLFVMFIVMYKYTNIIVCKI